MALDINRLAQAMEDEAVVELQAVYGAELDETKAREGIAPMALGFARAVIEEFQNNAVVDDNITVKDPTLTTIIGYTTTEGTIS
jgi:hypothetical protein